MLNVGRVEAETTAETRHFHERRWPDLIDVVGFRSKHRFYQQFLYAPQYRPTPEFDSGQEK
ncbi:MAG: hypothetical protein JEZ00_14085 [Anaerolineaceae bacterium]|nr:hypothetical protein [Anaerolineaceae bacterium]